MKYHINSKHEHGKQIFSDIKLAKIFLGDNDDGDVSLTLRRRIKSHLLFAGIIRSSPFSLR